jgi:spore germination protein YaaH
MFQNSIQVPTVVGAETLRFADVPSGHWAEANIHQLRDLGITGGQGDNLFGMGKTITRAEFVTFLVRLRGWQSVTPKIGSYSDNMDTSQWYYSNIETALTEKVITKDSTQFRPNAPITREEMAVMIVNSLGYGTLATTMTKSTSPYKDVSQNVGTIILLKDFGIINGVGDGIFAPRNTAKREEAAAILMRMVNKINTSIKELNGFYAVSAYSQIDLIPSFDAVSFAWGNVAYDPTTKKVSLKVTKPNGYEEPLQLAKQSGSETRLNIYGTNSLKLPDSTTGYMTYLLSDNTRRLSFIKEIVSALTSKDDFDGVVIDFEDMTGTLLKSDFNKFLKTLKSELTPLNKTLTVMVHPDAYYDAYDYTVIGEVADHIILMAHDFNAKKLTQLDMTNGYVYTPLTPFKEVYLALEAITNKATGVADKTKISLQLSFATAQWGVDASGKVTNSSPYTPDYGKLATRLKQSSTTITYDLSSQNPKAVYKSDTDQLTYTIWYEDSRSVEAKINLAKMFGINDISIWRLGNIPTYEYNHMDVMTAILKQK